MKTIKMESSNQIFSLYFVSEICEIKKLIFGRIYTGIRPELDWY